MVAAIKTNVFIEKDKKAIANVTKRMSLRATLTHTTPYLRLFGSILQPIKVLLEPLGYKASVYNIATIKYVMMTYIKDARYQHKLTKDDMQMCINKVFLWNRRQFYAEKWALHLGGTTNLDTTSAKAVLLNIGTNSAATMKEYSMKEHI